MKILLVMLGGSLGALSRYLIALTAAKYLDYRFPLGTLLANLAGCFLIGVSFALAERTVLLGPSTRLFFMTGFLGSLTTFSTYALETSNSLNSGSSSIAIANFLMNNVGGILLVFAGIFLIQFVFKEN
jgi:CrcB protein